MKRCEYKNEVETFFNFVMADLGHDGWKLNWTKGDAYLWSSRKVIDICPMDSVDSCKQMLLHEIAHLYKHDWHTYDFWIRVIYLVRKYMGQKLEDYQMNNMMSFYCPIIYEQYNPIRSEVVRCCHCRDCNRRDGNLTYY